MSGYALHALQQALDNLERGAPMISNGKTLLTTGHVAYCGVCDCRRPIHKDVETRIAGRFRCGVCGTLTALGDPTTQLVLVMQRWKKVDSMDFDRLDRAWNDIIEAMSDLRKSGQDAL